MGFFKKRTPPAPDPPEASERGAAQGPAAEENQNQANAADGETPQRGERLVLLSDSQLQAPEEERADDEQAREGQGAEKRNGEDELLAAIARLTGRPEPPREAGAADEDAAAKPELAADPAPPAESDLGRLRALMVGREITLLEEIVRRLNSQANPSNQARAVSQVITEALVLSLKKDDKLGAVLRPTVEQIYKSSIRRDPSELAGLLFPVIGPAIRRSISESLKSMLQGFSKALEHSFSVKGLRWRLEAWRTGRPFSEIVLLHNLLYQVEQIFFVHTETGLLLDHLAGEGVAEQDPSQVAAMLTAIQNFVSDSFAQGGLETLTLGDLTIYVERSPKAYLACAVRGAPPVTLAASLRKALELMVMDCFDDLENFDGDPAPFVKTRRYVEELLNERQTKADRDPPRLLKRVPAVLVLGLLAVWAVFGYFESRDRKLALEVRRLTERPGLELVSIKPDLFKPWELTYLRDPLVPSPASILGRAGLPLQRFNLTVIPYASLDRDLVLRRITASLNPPPGVRLEFGDDRILRLSGAATLGWIAAAEERARVVTGVAGVDLKGLTDPRLAELKDLMASVDGLVIHFPPDKTVPVPEDADKLARAVDDLVAMEKLAERMDVNISLIIYGHTDATGSLTHNYDLSQSRAKLLAAMLYARGSGMSLTAYGMGAEFAEAEAGAPQDAKPKANPASRKIELKVRLNRRGGILELDGADAGLP